MNSRWRQGIKPWDSEGGQRERIKAYYSLRQSDGSCLASKCEWGGLYCEPPAKSAVKSEFFSRPAGAELVAKLQPTDHLCIDKYECLYRNMQDFIVNRRWFEERSIVLHIVDFLGVSVDSSAIAGEWLLSGLGMLGEIEQRLRSRQHLGQKRLSKTAGQQVRDCPFFCEVYQNEQGNNQYRFLPWALPAMERIAKLREGKCLDFKRIAKKQSKELLAADIGTGSKRSSKCQYLYRFYKGWLDMGKPDINGIRVTELVKRSQELGL